MAAILNHPASSMAWLAKKHANFDLPLKAGEVILAGSFTSLIKVKMPALLGVALV